MLITGFHRSCRRVKKRWRKGRVHLDTQVDWLTQAYLLESDRLLASLDVIPLSGSYSREAVGQNDLTEGFPQESPSDTMVRCTITGRTRNVPVHEFAQTSGQLAAHAAADVSPSSVPRTTS
jgi:hypothetical protein